MLGVDLKIKSGSSPRILCLGAHSDDIEIGCGGTILKLIRTYPHASIHWITLSANSQRAEEARASAEAFLCRAETKEVAVESFLDGFFPYIGAEIKVYFEQLKDINPDLIFTHYRNDLHQDHRIVSELTWNTFRNHFILEYEIPKYDGGLGSPNLFVHLDEEICQEKVKYILESFITQRGKQWFTEDTFLSLLRLRGVESNSPDKYAEAFYCRKMTLLTTTNS
jgi:LmbE family N-acetylglucosaminyl deacetylase